MLDLEHFADPIFRGCTRPAMLAGVPMVPLLVVSGVFLLTSMWSVYLVSPYVSLFLGFIYVPILIGMRQTTKKDDQRLRQLLLRARMRWRHRSGFEHWQAVAFSPIAFKRRRRR